MKRKVIFGALAALFLGGGIVTTLNLTQKEQVSDLTLANIEAMTIIRDDDDGTDVKTCYVTGGGSSDFIIICDYSTTDEKIYPCSSTQLSTRGVSSKCTK